MSVWILNTVSIYNLKTRPWRISKVKKLCIQTRFLTFTLIDRCVYWHSKHLVSLQAHDRPSVQGLSWACRDTILQPEVDLCILQQIWTEHTHYNDDASSLRAWALSSTSFVPTLARVNRRFFEKILTTAKPHKKTTSSSIYISSPHDLRSSHWDVGDPLLVALFLSCRENRW